MTDRDDVSWGQGPDDPERSTDGAADPDRGGGPPDMPWGQGPTPDHLRPLNLGDVLDGMFRLSGQHWRALAIALGVIVVPLSLLSGLVLAQVFNTTPGFLQALRDPQVAQSLQADPSAAEAGRLAGTAVLSGLAGLLLTPLIYGIAVWVGARVYRVGVVDPMDAVRSAGRRYPALLGATLLLWIVPTLIFLLPGIVVGVGAAAQNRALLAIGGLGFLASMVFAVIAATRLLLAVPVVMLEQVGPIRSLRRSDALVKGRTGMVLGMAVVVWIIVTIIGGVLTVPFQILGSGIGRQVGAVAATAGQIVSSLVTNSLIGVALVLIYYDRRVRAEGYDLSELAGELGEPTDPQW